MNERNTTIWVALSLGVAGFVLALAGCSDNQLHAAGPDLAVVPDLAAARATMCR